MLDRTFRPTPTSTTSYDLNLPIDSGWSSSSRRLLIILQTVESIDLKKHTLASGPALKNALKYARQHARRYNADLPDFAFAVINWNDRKSFHLHGEAGAQAESEFKTRVQSLIKKLKPTHILFSGDLSKLYPVDNAELKIGWVHEFDGRKITSTLDFARLLEKQGTLANLLGFWCRNLANLMLGYLPHSLKDHKSRPSYVDTIKKFDYVMSKWDQAKVAAVDTETRSLAIYNNPIYTAQLAFDDDPTRGFVIPIDHPHEDNPFDTEQRRYIKKRLRKALGALEGPELVTMNGAFDLRVLRSNLKLDLIHNTVWEITAGEHLLDENISSLATVGAKSGGLAAIYTAYGNDSYISGSMAFSKAERATTGQISPADKDFLIYAALDVTSILGIRLMQMERASYQDLDGKPYRPYFERHMRYQMSDTVHQLSHLKATGSLIDIKYLRGLLKPDSVLAKAIVELTDEFKDFPEVKEANRQLLAEAGFKSGSLFGNSGSQWVFSLTKPAHKAKLFFEVMKLKAVNQTATGQDAVDKDFVEHYQDRNFLVAMFGEFQAASKLQSTYVKGWYKKLTREADGAIDNHLRADYKFFNVDTGRLASADPNLQNIPTRGKLSKIIKEAFITADGHLLIRFDYSAHEIRGWSIVSGDKPLADAFREGQKLRQQLIKAPSDKIRKELKTKGDLHIQNVFRFFDKWVEKSDPLRDAIKGVTFGLLYGKSAQTLGHDTKKADIGSIRASMNAAHKAGDKKAVAAAEQKLKFLMDEDRTDYAQGIIDKVFAEFQRGHRWVLKMQEFAENKYYVYSPIGRIRHLYAAMTGDRRIISRQVRRGMNAPIQGFASEIAVKSSRSVLRSYHLEQNKIKPLLGLEGKYPVEFARIVHDAQYYLVPFEMVLVFLHIMQWEATYGVTQQYEKEFGLKFTVEPEIEIEVGVKDTKSYKWDWELPNLIKHLEAAVADGIAAKFYTEPKEVILGKILAPWKDAKTRQYLQEFYPLLGVKDLDKEIASVVAESN